MNMTRQISETRGNSYIRLTIPSMINTYYEYVLSFTVFTSTVKFSKLISFHKAFMQITATIRLCFVGLSTFGVEFSIVFGAFSGFFFFVLKNHMQNFRDFSRTLQNTIAMSIGKFNFGALRAADEMAAWIFFVFSSKIYFPLNFKNKVRIIIQRKSLLLFDVVLVCILCSSQFVRK